MPPNGSTMLVLASASRSQGGTVAQAGRRRKSSARRARPGEAMWFHASGRVAAGQPAGRSAPEPCPVGEMRRCGYRYVFMKLTAALDVRPMSRLFKALADETR